MQETLGREKTNQIFEMRDSILNAVKNGNHTFPELRKALGTDATALMREIEFLEDLELFRVDPPDAPATSWWTKRPKGKIKRENGRLIELPPENGAKFSIEIKTIESPPAQIEKPETLTTDKFEELPVSQLDDNPDNPRGAFKMQTQSFLNMVDSVKEKGIKQPLLVKRMPSGRFMILIGHRRRKAAEQAGLKFVPCIIQGEKTTTETDEDVMLTENIQREDLTPMQEARSFYKRWKALGKDVHAVARALNLTQSHITGRIRLLKLDESIQRMVDERKITSTNALLLTQLEKPTQLKLISRAVSMKSEDLRVLVNNTKLGVPARTPWKVPKQKRVTADDESFTRSWALKELEKAGETYFTAKYFRDAFDDVCQDGCVEMDDESMCISCPVPRLIAAMLRHKTRSEKNADS